MSLIDKLGGVTKYPSRTIDVWYPNQTEETRSTMVQTKHTPGPWEYDATGKYYTSDGVIRVNGVVICRMTPSIIGVPTVKETEANARLIAASPDMLEALEWVYTVLTEKLNRKQDAINVLQSTIKKARGEK